MGMVLSDMVTGAGANVKLRKGSVKESQNCIQ